jgi:hypothetical protein
MLQLQAISIFPFPNRRAVSGIDPSQARSWPRNKLFAFFLQDDRSRAPSPACRQPRQDPHMNCRLSWQCGPECCCEGQVSAKQKQRWQIMLWRARLVPLSQHGNLDGQGTSKDTSPTTAEGSTLTETLPLQADRNHSKLCRLGCGRQQGEARSRRK